LKFKLCKKHKETLASAIDEKCFEQTRVMKQSFCKVSIFVFVKLAIRKNLYFEKASKIYFHYPFRLLYHSTFPAGSAYFVGASFTQLDAKLSPFLNITLHSTLGRCSTPSYQF
jgi:hypothetical protein